MIQTDTTATKCKASSFQNQAVPPAAGLLDRIPRHKTINKARFLLMLMLMMMMAGK
jgi:hypothetical protein